jgi:flagellar motor switch protein FliN/FliY
VSSREHNLRQVMRLEVPVVVRLGERVMHVRDVLALVPGSIIEIDKVADKELDLLINDKQVGLGHAVKVGENFGIRLTFIGDVATRVDAALSASAANLAEDQAAADLAAQLLAGQL